MSDFTLWDNWFILAYKKNGIEDACIQEADKSHPIFNNEKENWNIYLGQTIGKGFLQSSYIVKYNKESKEILTKRGSIYKLGNPINDKQFDNLEHYFNT
jgi:hypothetical protein